MTGDSLPIFSRSVTSSFSAATSCTSSSAMSLMISSTFRRSEERRGVQTCALPIYAVDAIADLQRLFLRLDVYVAGALLDRIEDQIIDKSDDGRFVADLLQVCDVVLLRRHELHVVLGHVFDDLIDFQKIGRASWSSDVCSSDLRRRCDSGSSAPFPSARCVCRWRPA